MFVFYISDKNYTQTPLSPNDTKRKLFKNTFTHEHRQKEANEMKWTIKNLNLYPITFTFCGYLKHPLPFFPSLFLYDYYVTLNLHYTHRHTQIFQLNSFYYYTETTLLGQRFTKISKLPCIYFCKNNNNSLSSSPHKT